MNCLSVQELLSAYYDDELPDDQRCRLSDHISECAECARMLAGFEKLSSMAGALDTPAPPENIWNQLEQQLEQYSLDKQASLQPFGQISGRPRSVSNLFKIAATVLIAVAIGWGAYQSWLTHGQHDQFTVEFGRYLEEFHRDPNAAQEFLLAKYDNEQISPDHAIEGMAYQPVVAGGLPEGYSAESTYVMKMPCCTCVQCLCKRADGSAIAIFEHDDDERNAWFGDRPEMSTNCNGKRCSLVQLDDGLAASWDHGKRHITIVGLRDIAELTKLVAWFENTRLRIELNSSA